MRYHLLQTSAHLTPFQEISCIAQMRKKCDMDFNCAEIRAGGLDEGFELLKGVDWERGEEAASARSAAICCALFSVRRSVLHPSAVLTAFQAAFVLLRYPLVSRACLRSQGTL